MTMANDMKAEEQTPRTLDFSDTDTWDARARQQKKFISKHPAYRSKTKHESIRSYSGKAKAAQWEWTNPWMRKHLDTIDRESVPSDQWFDVDYHGAPAVRDIRSLMTDVKLDEPLYRGFKADKKFAVGDEFYLDSFASASLNLPHSLNFGDSDFSVHTLFEIHTKDGVRGAFVSPAEYEFLLDPDNKFRVIKVDQDVPIRGFHENYWREWTCCPRKVQNLVVVEAINDRKVGVSASSSDAPVLDIREIPRTEANKVIIEAIEEAPITQSKLDIEPSQPLSDDRKADRRLFTSNPGQLQKNPTHSPHRGRGQLGR